MSRDVRDPATRVRLRAWCAEQDDGLRLVGERRLTPWQRDGETVWCEVERGDGGRAWVIGRPECLQ